MGWGLSKIKAGGNKFKDKGKDMANGAKDKANGAKDKASNAKDKVVNTITDQGAFVKDKVDGPRRGQAHGPSERLDPQDRRKVRGGAREEESGRVRACVLLWRRQLPRR